MSKWEWFARRLVGEYAHAINAILCGDSPGELLEEGGFLAGAMRALSHTPHPSEVENPEDVCRVEDAAILRLLEAEYEGAKRRVR